MQTPSARFQTAVKGTWTLAKSMNSPAITSAHFLAEILKQPDDPAAKALTAAATNLIDFQDAITNAAVLENKVKSPKLFGIFAKSTPDGSIPLSSEAETVMKAALEAGGKAGQAQLSHLVSAMLNDSKCIAHQLLSNHTNMNRIKELLGN